jgi:PRTRC genetic system protein B
MENINRLSSPPGALGALYFLPGQYLFKRIEQGRESAKALSSASIARAFREFYTDTGWITRKILRYREEPEGNYVLSYESAGVRTIFVETDGGEVGEITCPLPTLILFGHLDEFYLWAAKGKKISPRTRLALAPLPNIGGNLSGKICFGSNEVPEAKPENLDLIWNLIFHTPFNRDHSAQKCVSEPKDVRKLLLNLAKKQSRRFPASELLETNATIEDLWERVVEKKDSSNF